MTCNMTYVYVIEHGTSAFDQSYFINVCVHYLYVLYALFRTMLTNADVLITKNKKVQSTRTVQGIC